MAITVIRNKPAAARVNTSRFYTSCGQELECGIRANRIAGHRPAGTRCQP